jgi:hypothetical protein
VAGALFATFGDRGEPLSGSACGDPGGLLSGAVRSGRGVLRGAFRRTAGVVFAVGVGVAAGCAALRGGGAVGSDPATSRGANGTASAGPGSSGPEASPIRAGFRRGIGDRDGDAFPAGERSAPAGDGCFTAGACATPGRAPGAASGPAPPGVRAA